MSLFALSPLPSAQLFEAAGLIGAPLIRFTAAFFAGRLVSYTFFAATAKGIQGTTLGATFRHGPLSPAGLALQVGMIAVLVLLAQIDWAKHVRAGNQGDG
jgi:uncharacterized membrane protein YdjX (TVP38/TMEM64 family)